MALPRTLGSGPCDDPILQRRGLAGSAATRSGSPSTGKAAGPELWLCVSRTSLYHSALFKKVELGSWWEKGSGGQLLALYTFASLRFQVSLFMVLPLRANFPSPQRISGRSRQASVSKAALACAGAGAQDQGDLMLSGRRGAGAGFSGVPPVSSGDATWSWCQARPRGEEPACASLSPWSRTFTG